MNKNIKIIPLLMFLLTNCNSNYYNGYLIINNINPSISYINEYRINSNYDYLIPIKSNLSLIKENIKKVKADDKIINDYDLLNISDNNYKYYLKINSKDSYSKLNIKLVNDLEYEFNLNLINMNNSLFNDEYAFKVIDFSFYEDIIYNYKISYILNFKEDVYLYLNNSLKLNHPLFKGDATLINMETGKETHSSSLKANLLKNTNYLLTISFEEDSSSYYFDEYVPFEIETRENYNFKKYYVIPKYDELNFSNILSKIF